MNELGQIRTAVLTALKDAGIEALEQFPEEKIKAYTGAAATVGVGAASGKSAGFGDYLGEVTDAETQTVRERYGKELTGQITVELRAERAADCEAGCERATEVLLSGLPEGIRAGELTWEAISWEKTTRMFLRRGTLVCRALFLADLGVEQSGLDRLIQACYSLLGLISYLTAGKPEVRAWTIKRGTKAPQAAGKIHSDFERGFIRAEVIAFDDMMKYGSVSAAKEKGQLRSEGKEYVVQDGDMIYFRFNV